MGVKRVDEQSLKIVGDAIRAKFGLTNQESNQLVFPDEFAKAINDISTGISLDDIVEIKSDATEFPLNKYGDNIWRSSNKIQKIDYPNVTSLKEDEFYGQESLKYINLPSINNGFQESQNEIPKWAFYGCTSLIKLTGIKPYAIRDYAFDGCTSLIDGGVDLSGCVWIYRRAFRDCTSLTNIDSSTLGEIYDYAFCGCTSLKTVKLTRDNVELQGDGAFRDCTSLSSVNIPNGCWRLFSNTFYSCTRLQEVNIPHCNDIYSSAFAECSSLERLHFLELNFIAVHAFIRCSKLSTFINDYSDICDLENINAFEGTPIANGTGYIYVPKALVEQYKAAPNWSAYANQIRAIEDYPDITGNIQNE